jgi:hypothetical protein
MRTMRTAFMSAEWTARFDCVWCVGHAQERLFHQSGA